MAGMRAVQVAALTGVIAILFFTLGFYMAYSLQQGRIAVLEDEIASRDSEISLLNQKLVEERNRAGELSAEVEGLNKLVEELENAEKRASEALDEARRELQMLRESLDDSKARAEELERKIESLKDILQKLQNDRVLLNWIRQDIPNDRKEAMRYWNDTRNLAAQSDPSLAAAVDEIRANLGIYFDWLESFPEDVTFEQSPFIDICSWILQNPDSPYNFRRFCQWVFSQPPGVELYGESINSFIDSVYLVVMSHIDSLAKIIEEE